VGVVLDSTVVVDAERAGRNHRQMIESIIAILGDTEATLSAVTVVELAHGIERADSARCRQGRERFLEELLNEIPIEPVSLGIAFRAGRIAGSLQAWGVTVALGDLLIGATALELGFEIATRNVWHFRLIPGLKVTEL